MVLRKTILIIVAVICCTCFCCTKTEHSIHDLPAQHNENDFDNRFGMGNDNLVETADAYYYCFFSSSYIYYYDKMTGNSGVLCAKPECVHDEEEQNNSCNGYVDLFAKSLNYWNGKLHYVSFDWANKKPALFTINPDGNGKSAESSLDFHGMENTAWPQRYEYHRGKLYGWNVLEKVVDGEPLEELSILSFDPGSGEMHTLFAQNVDGRHTPFLFFYREYVYFCISYIEKNDEDDHSVIELRRWNINEESIEDVFITRTEKPIGSRFRFWVKSPNEIYLIPQASPEGEPTKLYLITNGGLKEQFAFDRSGRGDIGDGIAVCCSLREQHLELRAFDGKLIWKGKWDMDCVESFDICAERLSISSIWGDSNKLYFSFMSNEDDDKAYCYLVQYDLTRDTPEAKMLIRYAYN